MTMNAGGPTQAAIEADANVPIIRITRDFAATPSLLMAAHLDPELCQFDGLVRPA